MIGVSGAKFHEETDFDVPRSLAPQNPSKKAEKLISETKTFWKKKIGVEKWNVPSSLKRVLAKFEAERSLVWGVNGRSKFRKKVSTVSVVAEFVWRIQNAHVHVLAKALAPLDKTARFSDMALAHLNKI